MGKTSWLKEYLIYVCDPLKRSETTDVRRCPRLGNLTITTVKGKCRNFTSPDRANLRSWHTYHPCRCISAIASNHCIQSSAYLRRFRLSHGEALDAAPGWTDPACTGSIVSREKINVDRICGSITVEIWFGFVIL